MTGGDTTCNFVQMRLRSYPGKPVSRQAQNLLFDVYFKYGFNILITVQILNAFGRFLLVTSDNFLIQYSNLVRQTFIVVT